jgi:hypothetical protein
MHAFIQYRDSSVYIGTGYGLDGWGSTPDRGTNYSLLHSVQTGSGFHVASSPIGTLVSFVRGQAVGA